MASDAGIFGLANRPTVELIDPFTQRMRALGYRNALAAQDIQGQQIEQGQMALEAARQSQTQDAQFRALYGGGAAPGTGAPPVMPPPGPAPDAALANAVTGDPAPSGTAPGGAPAAHEVSDDQILAIYGPKGYGLISARQNANKAATEHRELLGKVQKQQTDYWASLAAGLDAVGYEPGAVAGALSQAAAHGYADSPEFQLFLKTAQENPAGLPVLARQAIAASPDAQKSIADTAKTGAETAQQQLVNAGGLLGSTRDQRSYTTAYNRLEPELRQLFTSPAQWTPAASADARQRGMTAEQQTTAAEAAQRDAQTAANENARLGLERERLSFDKSGGGSLQDPNYLAGVVRGEIQINPRDKNYAAISAAAKAIDSSWTSDRFSTAQHYRQSLTSGPESRTLGAINQGVSHIGELEIASQNLGHNPMQYAPGFVGNWSGDVKRYKDSLSTAGAEIASMLAKGQATQHEHDLAIHNLDSGSPSARGEGIDQYAKLIGGRIRQMAKAHAAATGEIFPVERYIDSDAIDTLKKHDVDAFAIAEKEKPTWMKAKNTAIAGVAPANGAPAAANLQQMSTDDLFRMLQ